MGHAAGLNSNYGRSTPNQILDEYCKAVSTLTIIEPAQNVQTLKKQQEALEKRQEEKDMQIEQLVAKIQVMEQEKEASHEMTARIMATVDELANALTQVKAEVSIGKKLAAAAIRKAEAQQKQKQQQHNQKSFK